jgi:hypothetical protein
MKIKLKHILITDLIVNVFLVFRYNLLSFTTQCGPCLPNIHSPPCETQFMHNIYWYFFVWNAIIIFAIGIWKLIEYRKIDN